MILKNGSKICPVLVSVVSVPWLANGMAQDAMNKGVEKHIPDLIFHVCFVIVLTSSIVVKTQYVF